MTSLDEGMSTRSKVRRAIFQLKAQRELLVAMVEREAVADAATLQGLIRRVQQPREGWVGRSGQRIYPKANINSLGELQSLHGKIDHMVGAIMMCDEMLELLTEIYNRPKEA